MSDLRGLLVAALGISLIAVVAYWLLFFAFQRALLYPRPGASGADAGARLPAEQRAHWLELPAGRVEARLLPSAAGRGVPAPLLVFAHGNAELIDDWVDGFTEPRAWGLAVLLVEYPGYGRSAGSPSQASITEALVAAYDWAVAHPGVDSSRVIGYGRSLGGGAVCALSAQRALAALVLESTFTSVRSMARRFGLPGFLVRDPFDNVSAVRAFTGPILLVHGERDDLIAPAHAAGLRAAAPRAALHLLPCGHNDCPRPWSLVRSFFAEHRLL